jgi:hypothetical protein
MFSFLASSPSRSPSLTTIAEGIRSVFLIFFLKYTKHNINTNIEGICLLAFLLASRLVHNVSRVVGSHLSHAHATNVRWLMIFHLFSALLNICTYIYTHKYIHIYIHVCVCVYVCVYIYMVERWWTRRTTNGVTEGLLLTSLFLSLSLSFSLSLFLSLFLSLSLVSLSLSRSCLSVSLSLLSLSLSLSVGASKPDG